MVAGLANLCNVSNSKIIRSKEAQSLFFYAFIFFRCYMFVFIFLCCVLFWRFGVRWFGGGSVNGVLVGLLVLFFFSFFYFIREKPSNPEQIKHTTNNHNLYIYTLYCIQ